jgi:hypothetical protein
MEWWLRNPIGHPRLHDSPVTIVMSSIRSLRLPDFDVQGKTQVSTGIMALPKKKDAA